MTNNHYYSKKQDNLIDDIKEYKLNILDNSFTFKTNSGVFSRNYIDFGSFTLLKAFTPHNKTLLDMGCGNGVMGIVLSKVYNLDVTLVDINETAVRLSSSNSKLNNVITTVVESNLYENVNTVFDQIITNPPIRAGKKVVFEIYEKALDHLVDNGFLWVVIQKKQGALSSISFLETLYQKVEIIDKKKGYFVIRCQKG